MKTQQENLTTKLDEEIAKLMEDLENEEKKALIDKVLEHSNHVYLLSFCLFFN